MTRMWSDFLAPDARLEALYGALPARSDLILRSIHLTVDGPMALLRVDLPEFPADPPAEWIEAGCDTVQVTLAFHPVVDLSVSGVDLPAPVRLTGAKGAGRSAFFEVRGEELTVRFHAYEQVRAGHVSAYRSEDGSASPRHYFLGALDRRLHMTIPEPWRETFHGRL